MINANPDRNDMVARRAYEIWMAEGQPHGRDQAHWLLAERELTTAGVAPNGNAPKRKAARAGNGAGAAKAVAAKAKSARTKSVKVK